jgi:helix-turn-helix protein
MAISRLDAIAAAARPHVLEAQLTTPADPALHELLTVDDVAALLEVSKSWVYEHTRSRGTARTERLPYIKIGKYKRCDPQSVREFLERRSKIA